MRSIHTSTVYCRVRSVTQPAHLHRSRCGHSQALLWQSLINSPAWLQGGFNLPIRGPSACHPCALEHAMLIFFFNSNRRQLLYSYGILRNMFRYSFCNCPKYLDIWILNLQVLVVQKFSSCSSP